jgi:hypothetical protein
LGLAELLPPNKLGNLALIAKKIALIAIPFYLYLQSPIHGDLRIVLKDLGFDFDEIQSELEKNGKPVP